MRTRFKYKFVEDDELDVGPAAPKNLAGLNRLQFVPKQRKIISYKEMRQLPAQSAVTFDVEIYKNFFLIGFKHLASNSYFSFELSPASRLDIDNLIYAMWTFKVIGFNSKAFDAPIVEAAMKGFSLEKLFELSRKIIFEDFKPYGTSATFNHIDIMQVCPLRGSLKLYGGRIGTERIQELPIAHNAELTEADAIVVRDYNFNDLDVTGEIYEELLPSITMREQLSEQADEDLRSKSDAQIAESIIGNEYKRRTGHWPKKVKLEDQDRTPREYKPPYYIGFETPLLQNAFKAICNAKYRIDGRGYVVMPPEINGLKLQIGNNIFRMSIGGLHTSETKRSRISNEEYVLLDYDVASYYPKIILNGRNSGQIGFGHNGGPPLDSDDDLIYPPSMGPLFLEIYKAIVDRRIAAKKAKLTVEADGLKITTNGTFGKTGNPYSIMYAPELMLYITLTGQLSLLMLIEMTTAKGFEIVSANTDGIVFYCPRSREAELAQIVKAWEWRTALELEQTRYKGYYARDVNNYIAVKEDGKCKAKGTYSEFGSALNSHLSKNPEIYICSYAVQQFLSKGIPIDRTIYETNDIKKFVCVRRVNGGAHKNGTYLGQVVRWYYAQGERGTINYVSNAKKVGNTDGARPLMEMSQMPADLDRAFYEDQAIAMLYDIGYYKHAEQQTLFG